MFKSFVEENVSLSCSVAFLMSFLVYLGGHFTQFVPDQSNVLAKPGGTAMWWKKMRYSVVTAHASSPPTSWLLCVGHCVGKLSKTSPRERYSVNKSQCMGFNEFIMAGLDINACPISRNQLKKK